MQFLIPWLGLDPRRCTKIRVRNRFLTVPQRAVAKVDRHAFFVFYLGVVAFIFCNAHMHVVTLFDYHLITTLWW